MRTFLSLLAALVTVLSALSVGAYDKDTQACMFVCIMRNAPQTCKKERSVPHCRSCVVKQTARIKTCLMRECGLDKAEAEYESALDPRTVCG